MSFKYTFINKITSFVLSITILLSNIQMVYAQDNNKYNEYTTSYINPMYKDLDIKLNTNQGYSFDKEKSVNTFDSIKEAANYMKDEMVKRASNINFTVNSSYYKGIDEDIYNLAVDESNATNSSEGDYLKAHFGGYSANMSYTDEYVTFNYNVSYLSTYSQEEEVDKKVKTVLNTLNAYDMNEYEKIKAVHDYIVTNIDYDYTYSKHSAYNAIIENSVVCQGFSSLTYKMLKELGIGVRYITGVGNGGAHAWNIVRIKDSWYNIDNTWDENISNSSISYKYFLKNMSDFVDHTRDSDFLTNEFNKKYPMSNTSYIYTESDKKPVISASDKILKVGDTFNAKIGVSASDEEDGDITSKIVVKENTVNTSKVGTYKVVYEVTDSDKNTVSKEIKVTVVNIGWIKENNKWYYYNEKGTKQTGWLNLSGTWYYLRSNGEMATGWEQVGNKWYYLSSSGAMKTGWLSLNGTWYYLRSNGEMATGWEQVGNKWYYLSSSGAMKTGWLSLNGTWYYLRSSGEMATGWEKVNGNWYYMYTSGKMATNTIIDGWKIDKNGVATKIK